MAIQFQSDVPSFLRGFVINEIQLGRQISQGENSKIVEAKYEGLSVVVKQINTNHLSEQEIEGLRSSLLTECDRSSRLRHPNFVRFFGVYFPPEARMPSWVMELLYCDLNDLLERRNQTIPLEIKMSILHQIGLGLRYLHSQAPSIIHCDLNSRNILISKGLEVKITDMCTARLLDHQHSPKHKTFGTDDFMPPELFLKNLSINKYGKELDVFSFGCVMLHTFSQKWPTPSQIVTNEVLSEIDRRAQYLDKVPKAVEDVVVPLIKSCLENIPFDRPTAEEVCDQLETLVVNRENTLPDNLLQAQLMLQESQHQIKNLTVELQNKDAEVEALRSDMSKLQINSSPYSPAKQVNKSSTDFWSSLKLTWEQRTDLPASCWVNSVVELDGNIYIATVKSTSPLKYGYNNDHWTILPELPCVQFSFVAVPSRKQVLAIGGAKVEDCSITNELSNEVFLWDGVYEKWLDVYPNMPTVRCKPSSISHGSAVIVAGGISCRDPWTMTRAVEILHIDDSCVADSYWSVVEQLPHATCEAVPLIVNDEIYICVGSEEFNDCCCYASRNIVSAPLSELLQSSNSSSISTSQMWRKLPDMPYPSDSITHYQGRLITFCGVDLVEQPDEDNPIWKLVPLIHLYNPDTKSWDCVGNFPPGYYLGMSVHIKENKILFIGGMTGGYNTGEKQDLMTTCLAVTFTPQ